MSETTSLLIYEAAKTALAEAASVDEVIKIHGDAKKMRAYAKIAKNRTMQADAAVIILRAERMLGVMIKSAKDTGQIAEGRRKKSNVGQAPETVTDGDSLERITLDEAGIDRNLSSRAQKLATLDERQFGDKLSQERIRIESGNARTVEINGARTVMAGRSEPANSLDFFPTPPWATRALFEEILTEGDRGSVWEPACGEGHISGVLSEYFDPDRVFATDIHDYSGDGREPPGWLGVNDFLHDDPILRIVVGHSIDWIVTNPPFSGEADRALAFALKALPLARKGVALFVRTQWLEGVERYEKLFSVHPPTVIAQFAERVPLVRGRWDPQASTASQYCWVVWIKDEHPCGFEWIKPGRRVELTKADDVERFTARPVKSIQRGEPADAVGQEVSTPLPADRSLSAAPESPAATPEAGGEGDTHASALPAPLAGYEAALAAGAAHHGKHTIGTIEPIWRAAIAEGVAGSQVAFDTDSKMGSVLSWKAKLGLAGLGTSGRSAPRKPKVPA